MHAREASWQCSAATRAQQRATFNDHTTAAAHGKGQGSERTCTWRQTAPAHKGWRAFILGHHIAPLGTLQAALASSVTQQPRAGCDARTARTTTNTANKRETKCPDTCPGLHTVGEAGGVQLMKATKYESVSHLSSLSPVCCNAGPKAVRGQMRHTQAIHPATRPRAAGSGHHANSLSPTNTTGQGGKSGSFQFFKNYAGGGGHRGASPCVAQPCLESASACHR